MLDRRTFIGSAMALSLATAAGAATRRSYSKNAYSRAVVIDGLGGPGEFDPSAGPDAPLSARAIADVKASGVTAINVTVNSVGNGPRKFEETVAGIGWCEREIGAHPDVFLKVLTGRDLQTAKSTGRMGLIYGFQDTTMLDADLSRLPTFHGLGVRIVQPVYNRRNVMGDGCLEPADGGLSSLGRELIAELNRLNILVDLSHAGPRTISEGIAACKSPMAITHTGCRALVDVPRNTHDRELKALADRGGVAGIYFMPFLRASGQPQAEDLIRHLEHAVNVCGEDHVGLGTDGVLSAVKLDAQYAEYQRKFFEERQKAGIAAPGEAADVFNLVPQYNDPLRFLTLANDLGARGWSQKRIDKVLGGNFARLFAEVWKG
ncbi:membrane dipeptidase [Povalibacter uvarum]|uniref:Membrane dipeptidase n=1 Tax=Povalibacter uvarum TaxID=732238 RepID=A0A841HNY2_9GAMM|nr:membrane dipeptidase [Povalibacter uvarum]MBB6093848.1 membrane dipeptidase [Povalibacter uvarum]